MLLLSRFPSVALLLHRFYIFLILCRLCYTSPTPLSHIYDFDWYGFVSLRKLPLSLLSSDIVSSIGKIQIGSQASLWLMGRVEGRSFGGWGPSAELRHRARQVVLSCGPFRKTIQVVLSATVSRSSSTRRPEALLDSNSACHWVQLGLDPA